MNPDHPEGDPSSCRNPPKWTAGAAPEIIHLSGLLQQEAADISFIPALVTGEVDTVEIPILRITAFSDSTQGLGPPPVRFGFLARLLSHFFNLRHGLTGKSIRAKPTR